jgi:hypothetical protein
VSPAGGEALAKRVGPGEHRRPAREQDEGCVVVTEGLDAQDDLIGVDGGHRSALQGGDYRRGLRVAGGLDDLAVDDPHDVDATDRVVGAGAPDVAPADERPLVAAVDVLDLEVAGGVVDESLPRAERRVVALVAGARRGLAGRSP